MRGGGGRRVADVDQQQGRHHAVHSSNTTNNLASSRQGQETRSLPQGMRTIEPRIKSHLGTAARETGLRIAIPSESGTEMNIASGTRETEGERKIKGNVDPWIPDTGQVSTTFVVNSPESIATPLARTSAFDARYNASPEVSTGRRRRASTIGPRNTDSSGINRRQGSTGFEGNSSSVAGSTTAIQLSPTTPTGPSFAGFAGRVTLRDLTRVDERPSTVQQYLASSHPSSNRLSRQPSYNLRMSRNSPPEDALAIPLSEEASNQPYLELSHPLTSSSSSTIPFPPSRTPSRNQLVRSRHSYADINALSDPSPSSDGHLTFQPQDYDDRNLLPLSISRSTTPSVTPYATPYGSEAESEEGNGSDRRKRDRKRSDHVGYGLGMGMGMGRGGLWGGGMKGFDHDLSPRGSISGEGIEGRRMGRDNEGYSPSGGWFWGWTTSQQHQHQQPQQQSSLSKGFSSVKEVLRHDSFATNSTTSSGSSPSHSRYDFFSYGRDRDGKRGSGSTVNDEGPILIAPSSLMDRKMSGNGTLTGAKKGVNGKARNSRGVRYFGNWLKRTLGLDMVGVGGDSVTSARERKGGNSRLRMYRMTGGSERSTDRDEGALHLNYGKSRRGMGKRRTSGVPGKGSSTGGDRKRSNVLKRIAVALPDSLWTMIFKTVCFIAFAATVTFSLKYILNPDKAPLPWRSYCESQTPTYWSLQPPPGHQVNPHSQTIEYEDDYIFSTLPASSTSLLAPINHTSASWLFPRTASFPINPSSPSLDTLEPVGVFVGVFSTDKDRERRMMIRQTYGSHRKSRVPGTEGVRVKFILGRPRKRFAAAIKLEMETFRDIVLLDVKENMNAGKTHAFFSWAAANATAPDLQWSPLSSTELVTPQENDHGDETQSLTLEDLRTAVQYQPAITTDGGRSGQQVDDHTDWQHDTQHWEDHQISQGPFASSTPKSGLAAAWYFTPPTYLGERRPDYIVKADDDSFIMLGELERHLRATPRKMSIWGYLVKDFFMAGEAYALSMDLVRYIANAPALKKLSHGKEDKLTAKWMRMHPAREKIVWVSEKCWIYDHPKSGTVYSHGYLFPDEVKRIRRERDMGLDEVELAKRGGKVKAEAYSTVSKWGKRYTPLASDLDTPQSVEALVEGSEMSLLDPASRRNNRSYLSHLLTPFYHLFASFTQGDDTLPIAEAIYDRRPSRQERYNHDPMERGGTVIVHYIKRQSWFMETAMALLGHNEKNGDSGVGE